MVGIGCYGFINATKIYAEKMNLDMETYTWTKGYQIYNKIEKVIMTGLPTDTNKETKEIEVPKEIIIPDEDSYIGITQTTYEAFINFLEKEALDYTLEKEYVDKIKKQKPLRYNQGDQFLANHLSQQTTCSEIGKNENPIFIKAMHETIKENKENKENK